MNRLPPPSYNVCMSAQHPRPTPAVAEAITTRPPAPQITHPTPPPAYDPLPACPPLPNACNCTPQLHRHNNRMMSMWWIHDSTNEFFIPDLYYVSIRMRWKVEIGKAERCLPNLSCVQQSQSWTGFLTMAAKLVRSISFRNCIFHDYWNNYSIILVVVAKFSSKWHHLKMPTENFS